MLGPSWEGVTPWSAGTLMKGPWGSPVGGVPITGFITPPIETTANIVTTFSEEIDPATYTTVGDGTGSCELYNNTNPGWVAGAVVTTGNPICYFDPTAEMTADDSYTIFLSSAIKGLATGKSYNDENFTFTAVQGRIGNPDAFDPAATGAGITLSDSNTTATHGLAGNWRNTSATYRTTTGQYYWEVKINAVGSNPAIVIGMALAGVNTSEQLGANANSWAFYNSTTGIWWSGSEIHDYGVGAGINDVVMVALDHDNGKAWVGVNGTWFNSGDPAAGTNPSYTAAETASFDNCTPAVGMFATTSAVTINCGQVAFTHEPPSGFTQGYPVS